MVRTLIATVSTALAVVLALATGACESTHQEGVKSNVMTQWVTVNADTQRTTDAARAVFDAEGLKEIKATATNVDGTVTGKKADGTVVKASIQKKGDNLSEVSVNVGTMGDASLGAELAKKIKQRVEG